jgi:hypothetical protein
VFTTNKTTDENSIEWEDEYGTYITYGSTYLISDKEQCRRIDALRAVVAEITGVEVLKNKMGFY